MGLKNSQYYAIMREYEKKQLRNHNIQTARYEEVYKKLPEFKTLDESISILSVQYGKKLLNGDTKAVASLKEELAILRSSKQKLLTSAGFPADYLEPVYDCPDCKDTGYIGHEKCHCFKKAIIQMLYDQSNISQFTSDASFENFRLDLYPSGRCDKSGRSPRDMMKETLRICQEFVDTFGKDFRNLLFYGDVGVGKTYLSTCIAREIIKKEYSVLYFSAPRLFNVLAKNAFDKKDVDSKNMSEYILSCDLLIIDDLGTEYINSFISSQFFTCINERLLQKKSTIISTNLSLDSIADLYTERAFSRITSNYTLLKVIGDDIRIKLKLKHREDNSCYVEQKES